MNSVKWVRPLVLATCLAAGCDSATSSSGADAGDALGGDASGCAPVHVITARGASEASGEGRTAALVDQIVSSSHQSITRAALDYPATVSNYATNSAQGVVALKLELATQAQNCPNQHLVLAGYGEGGQVILDTLGGGGGGTLGVVTAPIAAAVVDHVVAVVTFGDPRHTTKQAYDLGTALQDGIYPRTDAQLQVLNTYASKIAAFCDADDIYCASGTSLQVAVTYLTRYQTPAATFVLSKIGD